MGFGLHFREKGVSSGYLNTMKEGLSKFLFRLTVFLMLRILRRWFSKNLFYFRKHSFLQRHIREERLGLFKRGELIVSLLWALGKLPHLELRGSMGVFKYRVPAMHFMIVLAYDLISFYFSIKARHSTLRLQLCTVR